MKSVDRVNLENNNSKNGIDIFVEKIAQIVLEYNTHENMILNFDQAPVGFTSPNKTTSSDKGSESVPFTNDKHRFTTTLSLSWEVLLIQLIYDGLTDNCHPRVKLPIHSISLTQTTIGQMKKMYWIISVVMFPFVEEKWKVLNLDQDAKALLFFDVLKSQPLLL